MSAISRRTLAKGAAWSVPAVAVAAAAPASALSSCNPTKIDGDVNGYFERYRDSLPDLTGVELGVYFHAPSGSPGAVNESSVWFKNEGSVTLSADVPLDIQFAFRNVSTSEAVNSTLTRYSGPATSKMINKPWAPEASNATSTNAKFVDQCSTDEVAVRRRDLNWGSSFVNVYSPSTGALIARTPTAVSESDAECIVLDGGGQAYGYNVALKRELKPGQKLDEFAVHLRDGLVPGGRLYLSEGVRVRGVFPPTWEDFLTEIGTVDDAVMACYRQAYIKRRDRWYEANEGLSGLTIKARGWSHVWDTSADPRGWTAPVQANQWIWSHEVGNFMAAGAEGEQAYIQGLMIKKWSTDDVNASDVDTARREIKDRDGVY